MELLNNGDAFYPRMLGAIEGAHASITIEAYIYWAGDVGRVFARALAERAESGVKVKINRTMLHHKNDVVDGVWGNGWHDELR